MKLVGDGKPKVKKMSLYSTLHGKNELSPILLAVLNIDQPDSKWKSGRFRDIYLNEDGTKIILYTRNGGGNREHYYDGIGEEPEGKECHCTGCIITNDLPKHPNYIRDWDDDFDCTYAYIEFSVPKEHEELCKSLATGKKPETISEKFEKVQAEMTEMTPEKLESDPRFKPMVDVLKKILDPKTKETHFEI
jgi:hypothetical protein